MRRWLIGGVVVLVVLWLAGTIVERMPEGQQAAAPATLVPTATSIPNRPPVLAPTATPVPPRPAIGQEARLDAAGLAQWHLTIDDAAQSAWVSAQVARDAAGLEQMVRSGRAFPVANGTRLLVLDQNPLTTRVRVLEGPYAGRVGVINTEHVIR